MKTSLKRIATNDRIELVGLLYEPESPTKKILVHVHGMAGNFYENKFLDSIAEILTKNGIAFFAFNNRGCEYIKDLYVRKGTKPSYKRIGEAFEKFEDCAIDISAAVDYVFKMGYDKINLSGHSLGSPKVAFYITETKDKRISSLLLLSPSDMLGLVKKDRDLYKKEIKEAKEMAASNKGSDFMSHLIWGEYLISADTYVSLFDENSKAGIFNFHISSDQLKTLGQITIPLFAIGGRKDDAFTVSLEETMERIKKAAVKSPKVETIILGDADHGYNGYEDALANEILKWIQNM